MGILLVFILLSHNHLNMQTELISADTKNRAKSAGLRTPHFRRMLRLVWPHRRFVLLGLIGSVFYGFLHSMGIVAVLPVLKVILSDEGLHSWVDRSITEERLDLDLDIRSRAQDSEALGSRLVIIKMPDGSPLFEIDAKPFDAIDAFALSSGEEGDDATSELESIAPASFLQSVAAAEPGAHLTMTTRSAGDGALSQSITIQLKQASTHWRIAGWAAEFVPRAQQRGGRVVALYWVLGFMVVVNILSNLARFVAQYFIAVGVLRSVMDMRRQLYRKILRLPMSFFSHDTSDLVSRFVQDAQEMQRGLMSIFGKMLREPIKAAFLFGAAIMLDARMTLTMLLISPLAILIFWIVGRKIRKANRRLLQTYGAMIGALGTALDAIGIVKTYNAENVERKRLWSIDRRMFTQQLRIAKLEAFMRPMLEMLGVVGIAAVSAWLGSMVIREQIKIEEFGTLVFTLGMLIDPLRKLADVYPRVMRSSAGAQRIFEVIDAPAEAELLEGALELLPIQDRIEFRNVTFAYPDTDEPAVSDVNLTINKGETVALVGANGSGKTTLTKLLVRFYDPQHGAVLIDGIDIRSAKLVSLRRQMSMVSQDPVVFAMSIAENIAYGTRNPDEETVREAAKRAHAEEFIQAKPGGYSEPVGERGTTLSGGQRQRLCIARAMLRDAPILIFDEATSQIDSESEGKIQDAVREYAADRTTILIAHRLSTIRFAQRIIVMDRGRVVDQGTHEELFGRCELYATICKTQTT
ncbi:MAG: ABC transporter ATP-binding protein [Planctomycetes bacterium]|nr:ABC transporter ATP-binding protein [Planctomycetota bacterium]